MPILTALLLMLQFPAGDDFAEIAKRFNDWAQNAPAAPAGRREAPEFVLPYQANWRDPVDADAGTLFFQCAVEEWVEGCHRQAAPANVRGMVAKLGSAHWKERDAASRELEAYCRANPAETRWLFPMRRHPDLECAYRVNNILRWLNRCKNCEGRGWNGPPEYPWACPSCEGARYEWRLGAFD